MIYRYLLLFIVKFVNLVFSTEKRIFVVVGRNICYVNQKQNNTEQQPKGLEPQSLPWYSHVRNDPKLEISIRNSR